MENQVVKQAENEAEAGIISGFIRLMLKGCMTPNTFFRGIALPI